MPRKRMPLEWERQGDCIVVVGRKMHKQGYAYIHRYFPDGTRHGIFIHRLVCERRHGPMGEFDALHSCDNPPCINPNHIRPGTHSDNMRDMIARNRRNLKGERHYGATITEATARLILNEQGLSQRQIALKFGVPITIVKSIRRRKSWRHL